MYIYPCPFNPHIYLSNISVYILTYLTIYPAIILLSTYLPTSHYIPISPHLARRYCPTMLTQTATKQNLYIYQYIYLSTNMLIHLSIYPFVYKHAYPHLYLCIYLIYQPIRLSNCTYLAIEYCQIVLIQTVIRYNPHQSDRH